MSISVLFVCLGNICRSPTAEGVFRKKVEEAGLSHLIRIDSAGTADWHTGKAPDSRTIAAAARRDFALADLRARQIQSADLNQFDYVLAMDETNLADIRRLAPSGHRALVDLFLQFSTQNRYTEVPDPYYGGEDGFSLVLDLLEDAAEGLLQHIRRRHLAEKNQTADDLQVSV